LKAVFAQACYEDAHPFIDRNIRRQAHPDEVAAYSRPILQRQNFDFLADHSPAKVFILFRNKIPQRLRSKTRNMFRNLIR